MKFSKYNVSIDNYPRNGYSFIYNLFTHKTICISTKKLMNVSDELCAKMRNCGILVDDNEKEQNAVLNYYEENAGNTDELVVMLFLTRKCNCKCIYCYEDQQNAKFSDMSDTAYVTDVIIRLMDELDVKKLKIIFYGGEPLIKSPMISAISKFLFTRLKENYSFSIVTNGTLIKKNEFEMWNKLGLKAIKVTLDGEMMSHNKRRPYANGEGSYVDILNNLSEIKELTHIVVNIVLDASVTGIERLVMDLRARKIEPEISLCLIEPNNYTVDQKSKLVIEKTMLLAKMNILQSTKIAFDHGIICMGKNVHSIGIDANNVVYRCNGNLDSKIGTLSDKIKKDFIPVKKQCVECKYLPICFGGCLYELKCEKEYFEKTIPDLVKAYAKFEI